MSGKGEGHGTGMPVAYLNNVELGQQVAVSQCEVVSIKKVALGDPELGVLGQLMLQRGAQVFIQFQQGPQQAPLQRCREGGQVSAALLQAWGPCSAVASCQSSPVSRQQLSCHMAQAGTCICLCTETWYSHTGPHREGIAWTDLTVDWMGGLGKLGMTRLSFGVWHLRGCMGCSPTCSSPSSWAGTGFLMRAENLWKMSFPARFDSRYCGTSLGHLWGHGHSWTGWTHVDRQLAEADRLICFQPPHPSACPALLGGPSSSQGSANH